MYLDTIYQSTTNMKLKLWVYISDAVIVIKKNDVIFYNS